MKTTLKTLGAITDTAGTMARGGVEGSFSIDGVAVRVSNTVRPDLHSDGDICHHVVADIEITFGSTQP